MAERENIVLQEKVRHLESELLVSNTKTNKYKRIAKNFKQNLDQIEDTLANLKRLSQDEIKTFQKNVKFLEKAMKSKTTNYLSNLKSVASYL